MTKPQPMQLIDHRILMEPIAFNNLEYKNYFDNLNKNIRPIILQSPQVSFYFIFSPPFPLLNMQIKKLYSQTKYIKMLLITKQFVHDMEPYKNVRVFGFGLEKFTEDLRIYKDASHYHIEVNNYLSEKIAREDGLLTKSNIMDYLIKLDDKVTNYRLPEQWTPVDDSKRSIKEKGFLTMAAAREIIEGGMHVSDEDIIKKNKIGNRDEKPRWVK